MFLSILTLVVFCWFFVGGALVNPAHAAPPSFVYEGVLEDSNGPITSSTVLILRIYDPSVSCLLYEESQTVTPGSDGSFSIRIGSAVGATKRTSSDPGLSLNAIFYSSGQIRAAGTNCSSGYTASSSDVRSLVLNVNGTDLLPAIEISSAPFAVNADNADRVGGYVSTRLLRTDGSTALPAMDDTKAALLMNLLNGTLTTPTASGEVANKSYVDAAVSGLLSTSTSFSGDVSGTSSAMSVDKIKGKSVDDTGIASGKVLKYDGSKWVMGDDNAGSSGLSSLGGSTVSVQTFATPGTTGTAPTWTTNTGTGTHTLNIPLASTTGVTAGLLSKADYDRLGVAEKISGKAVDTTAPTAAGQLLSYDSANNKWKASTAASPSDGQVLKWNNTTQNWEPGNATAGWTAVDASYSAKGIVQFNTDASTSGMTVTSGVASVVRTTTGEFNKILSLDGAGVANMYGAGLKGATTGQVTLKAPTSFTSYTLTLPASTPTAGQSLQSDASGNLSWVNSLGSISNSAALTAHKIWVGNASNKAAEVSVGGDATLDGSGTLTLSSVVLAGTKGSAQYVPQMTYDSKGRVTAVTEVPIDDTSKLSKSGGTMTGVLHMNAQDLTSTGHISMAASKYLSLSANSTDGTSAGQMWYDSGTGKIKYHNGTSAVELGVAGAGITSLNGLTSGSQSLAVATTGTSPLISSSGSTHTLSLPMASTTGATAGLITKSEYDTFNSKQSTSLTSGNVWVGNSSGIAEARSLSGDLSLSSTGVGTVAGIKGKLIDTSITPLSTTGQVLFYSSSATKWKPSAATTPADGQVLKWNNTNQNWEPAADNAGTTGDASYSAKGLVQFDTDATTSGLSVTAGVAKVIRTTLGESNKILALDGSGVGHMFGTGLKGTISGEVTLKAANTSATYTLALPSGAPAAGQTLQSDAMGNLSWTTPSGGGGSMNVANIKNASSVAQFPTTCTQSQTLFWNSALDIYECVNIKLNDVATVTTAAADYYVNSSGDDSLCNGLVDATYSAGAAPNCAFKTLQGALNKIPHIIRHNTNLRVTSDLYAPGMNSVLASIDKVIAAVDSTTGPFLTIEGYNSIRYLDGGGYSGTSGLLISSPSRGVQIKNIYIQNFTSKAVEVMGGVALLEGVSLMYNTTALSVSQSGMAMLFGNISITLPSTGSNNRGIEVFQGSVSSGAALNINLGSAQYSRGISVSHGDFSVEENLSITQPSSVNYQSGVEVSTGGQMYVQQGFQISIAMNSSNTSSSALEVRGGSLSVSGSLTLNYIGGRGLTCESGARCQIYGTLSVGDFSYNASSFVSVRTGSILQVHGNFSVSGVENASSSAVEITDNSIFKYSPYESGKTFTMNRGSSTDSNSTAIRLKTGSSFVIDSGSSPSINVTNNYGKFYEAFNNSTVVVNGTIAGTVPTNASTDKSSRYMNFSSTNVFPIPGRSCPSGMTSAGVGESSVCIDTANYGTDTQYNAINTCSNRGLKLCSQTQYSYYCGKGGVITDSWAEGPGYVSCSSTTFTLTPYGPTSGSKAFRCCL